VTARVTAGSTASDGDRRSGLLFELLGGAMVQELARSRSDDRADRRGCEQGWCEQAHDEADGAHAGGALADHVVGLLDVEVAFEVFGHHDGSMQVAAAVQDGLVVLHGGVLGQVAADQDVDRFVVERHAVDLPGDGTVQDETAW
jgi:hypothetical protein